MNTREVLAFAAIYILWGGTFLAVRVAVLEIPAFFAAGIRFFSAGVAMYFYMRLRGEPRPSAHQWRNLSVVAVCMFVATYAPLFWAEQYVSSSMTAVIEATLPITTIGFEMFVFRSQMLDWRVACGVLAGFAGVALLVFHNSSQHLPVLPSLVILASGVAWSLGAVLSRRLALPTSQPLTAGASMMLGGAVLLALSAAHGDMHPLPIMTPRAVWALLYLAIFGSLVAYTAYVWLLSRFSATTVSSHAYVNPVVALALGYFAAGETLTARSIAASTLIVASVFLILAAPRQPDASRRLAGALSETVTARQRRAMSSIF